MQMNNKVLLERESNHYYRYPICDKLCSFASFLEHNLLKVSYILHVAIQATSPRLHGN